MPTELIAFKKKQIASLTARETPHDDDTVAALDRLKSEVRALEGHADDPRDSEIARLRAHLDKAHADNASLEKALAKANAAKPAPKKKDRS